MFTISQVTKGAVLALSMAAVIIRIVSAHCF